MQHPLAEYSEAELTFKPTYKLKFVKAKKHKGTAPRSHITGRTGTTYTDIDTRTERERKRERERAT